MKKDKGLAAIKKRKIGKGSDPENKFKEDQTPSPAVIDNIITSPVDNVKARSSRSIGNEGTNVDYSVERS